MGLSEGKKQNPPGGDLGGPGRRRRGLGALQTPLCLLVLRILLPKLLELRGPSFRAPPCHTPILGVYIFPELAQRPHPWSSSLLPCSCIPTTNKVPTVQTTPTLVFVGGTRGGLSPPLSLALGWPGWGPSCQTSWSEGRKSPPVCPA